MADTNIYIRNGLGKKNNTQRTSTNGTRKGILEKKRQNTISGIKKGSQIVNKVTTGNVGVSNLTALTNTGKLGITMLLIGKVVGAVSKGADLYINHLEAKTGDSVYYGNVKATKNLIMSLGLSQVYGAINNEIITKQIVRRQNYALEYGQQLYNLNNYGEKNKIR